MLSLIIIAFCPTDCVLGCAARSQWGRIVALISEQQGVVTEKHRAGMPGHLHVPIAGWGAALRISNASPLLALSEGVDIRGVSDISVYQ